RLGGSTPDTYCPAATISVGRRLSMQRISHRQGVVFGRWNLGEGAMGTRLRKIRTEPIVAPAGSRCPAERSLPLYREIANQLISLITDGTYPVGHLLPPETELAAIFLVSRHTIREAIRYLQSMGLVTRRQGRGTIVRSTQVQRKFKLAI